VIFFADAIITDFLHCGRIMGLLPSRSASSGAIGFVPDPFGFSTVIHNLISLFGILAIIAYLWFRLPFSPEKKFFMALSLTWAPVAN